MNDPYLNARRYYAKWVGVDPERLDEPGVMFTISAIRDEKPDGYSSAFPFFGLVRFKSVHICIGETLAGTHERSLRNVVNELQNAGRNHTVEDLVSGMHRHGVPVKSSAIKFYLRSTEHASYSDLALRLTREHYHEFLSLYRAVWPAVDPSDWLQDYYENRLAKLGLAWGVFEDDIMVSATDAGSIPYLSDVIVEPGIMTHPEYRKRGYARLVCSSVLRHILDLGLTPVWSCGMDNTASARLAKCLGFAEFGRTIVLDAN